jgi:nitrate/TMAO reductase-like tetraheme cytochrome c subunit
MTSFEELVAACCLQVMALPAMADSDRLMPREVPAAYKQECGSCHVAYPPALLPAQSWARIMRGLDNHYGTDAALDLASHQSISSWLALHAGTYKRVAQEPPQDRISRSAWFERKHRKIDVAVWALPSVKGAANCGACHAGADQGRFDDDDLRAPEGLTLRQRWSWGD